MGANTWRLLMCAAHLFIYLFIIYLLIYLPTELLDRLFQHERARRYVDLIVVYHSDGSTCLIRKANASTCLIRKANAGTSTSSWCTTTMGPLA